MAKYGEDNFTLEIIDFADTYDELKEKEKYWIKQYNSTDKSIGYNLTEGGDGTFGRKHSEDTKEKIRQKALGRKVSEETKKKMSETRLGKCSDKQREHLLKLTVGQSKKIYQYDTDFNLIGEYNSIKEASKITGIDRNTIGRQLKKEVNPGDWRVKFIWKSEEIKQAA